jgi:DNA-3-methyladenine glycosylase
VHNAVIFGPAGYLHCFFTYGLHWCSNVVSGEEGTSSAVLLRAGEVTEGLATARARRPSARKDSELARGPARLSVCLGLAGPADGLDLLSDASPVRLELQPAVSAGSVLSGPRVGISVAAGRPWRFWLAGDATVSAYKAGGRDSRRRQARS